MQDIPDQVPGGELTSAEYNQHKDSNQNLIESTGQTLSAADAQQLGKGAASYAAVSTAYTDSGVADAYVLSTIGSLNAPELAVNFEQIRFRAAFENTGACSVNINGRGQVSVKKTDGVTDPDAGDISATKDSFLRYDSANTAYTILNVPAASETVAGIVERATNAEASAGVDTIRYINSEQLAAAFSAATGKVAQQSTTLVGAVGTTSNIATYDDVIMTNTEGGLFITSASFTPTDSGSTLKIDGVLQFTIPTNSQIVTMGIFEGATVDAVAVFTSSPFNGAIPVTMPFSFEIPATSITPRVYTLRAGMVAAGTLTINGLSGVRRGGGVGYSSLTITEITA